MLIRADARSIPLANECVQCVVTSPPYWGLRDYGADGQLGLEKTPQEYVGSMVQVFQEVRRVLKADGTLWLNLGDSYSGSWGNYHPNSPAGKHGQRLKDTARWNRPAYSSQGFLPPTANSGLKPKDLCMIPARVALALQADGWYLRSDIIWSKPNPMPESVTDRPTKAHEYIFLLSKSERYYFDAEAVRIPPKASSRRSDKQRGHSRRHAGFNDRWGLMTGDEQASFGANIRTVWEIATRPYSGAHFATFPEAIPERCIKAGSRVGDLVLDPFGGSGTTGRVAERLNRKWICMDLKYHELSSKRTTNVQKELILQ